MESTGGKAGLVLAGGGARAAYQVGVLQALKEMLPDPKVNPVPHHLRNLGGRGQRRRARGARRRLRPRRGQPARGVAPFRAAPRLPLRFPRRLGQQRALVRGLPVRRVPQEQAHLAAGQPARWRACSRAAWISRASQANIEAGALDAVSITCSGYTSGQSCTLLPGRRALRGLEALAAHRHQDAHRRRAPHGLERDPVPLPGRTTSTASTSATAPCARSRP